MIDYNKIVQAEDFYEKLGYKKVDAPWLCFDEAYLATKPSDAGQNFSTFAGNLVASGEQSFLQMMMNGIEIKKAQCTTPCFRDEAVQDELHHQYFMKTELINTDISKKNFTQMIKDACEFYWHKQHIDLQIVEFTKNIYEPLVDIVGYKSGIELGSYGLRTYKNFKWFFGTGVAEPRLSQVIEKEKFFK